MQSLENADFVIPSFKPALPALSHPRKFTGKITSFNSGMRQERWRVTRQSGRHYRILGNVEGLAGKGVVRYEAGVGFVGVVGG